MSVAVVVGMQWGDEGKGKIIDLFSEEADIYNPKDAQNTTVLHISGSLFFGSITTKKRKDTHFI
jgi:hypothetical protein